MIIRWSKSARTTRPSSSTSAVRVPAWRSSTLVPTSSPCPMRRSGPADEFPLVNVYVGPVCVFWVFFRWLPSGERLHSNGKSPFLMGKSTISMAIFHCYVSSPEGTTEDWKKMGFNEKSFPKYGISGYLRISQASKDTQSPGQSFDFTWWFFDKPSMAKRNLKPRPCHENSGAMDANWWFGKWHGKWPSNINRSGSCYIGVSENSVPLNPMVNDHYPY